MNMKLWILLLSLSVGVLTESPLVNPCNSSPCQNGGRCSQASWKKSGYYCYCKPEYTGESCEIGKESILFRMNGLSRQNARQNCNNYLVCLY